jgi:hypothetical protein
MNSVSAGTLSQGGALKVPSLDDLKRIIFSFVDSFASDGSDWIPFRIAVVGALGSFFGRVMVVAFGVLSGGVIIADVTSTKDQSGL